MFGNGYSFNTNEVKIEERQYKKLEGWYRVAITGFNTLNYKDGTEGFRLKLEFTVQDGDAKGYKIFESLNMVHPNPKTTEIARQSLARICQAIDFSGQIQTGNEIIGRILEVKCVPDGEYTRVKGYRKAEGAVQPAAANPIPNDAPDWAK